MESVLFRFGEIDFRRLDDYILQWVRNRRLTDVYHSHDFYELICFLQGRGTQIVNDEEILTEEKTVMLLCPGDEHCFVEQSEDIEVISLSVRREHFELLSSAYGMFFEQRPHTFTFPRVSKLYDIYRENRIVSESDCTLILSTLLHAYIHAKDQFSQSNIPKELLKAVEEMKKRKNLKMGIPAFLSLSNYSQSHLSRLMKIHFALLEK